MMSAVVIKPFAFVAESSSEIVSLLFQLRCNTER